MNHQIFTICSRYKLSCLIILHKMKNIYSLEDWQPDKNIPNSKRFVDVDIHLKYPDQLQFKEFIPKERIKKIDGDHKTNLKKLLALNLFDNYEIIGTKKRPRGIKTRIRYNTLQKINKLDFIDSISVETLTDAVKIDNPIEQEFRYYAVKMTVVIEVEGIVQKMQSIEERIVLIKATSPKDAYDKLEKCKDDYTPPYLNSDGRFVRWRIESFDDCFDTDALTLKDLDNPNGVEVFSKLKSRKTKDATAWDGKF
jgi:hypothetical protein